MPDSTSLGIQFPLPDDIIRTGQSNAAKLAQDFQSLASTTNSAIRSEASHAVASARQYSEELAEEIQWSKTDRFLTADTDLSTLERGIHRNSSVSVANALGLPIGYVSALTVVELGNTAVLEQWGYAGANRVERYQAWRDADGNIGPWYPVGNELRVLASTTLDLNDFNQETVAILRNSLTATNAPRQGVNAILRVNWLNSTGSGVLQTWEDAQSDYAIFRRRSLNSGQTWTHWERINGQEAPPEPAPPGISWHRSDPVYFWGDSAVSGGGGDGPWEIGENLPGQLDSLLQHNTVISRGQGGHTSRNNLIRAGAVVIHAVPSTGVIPTSGPVELDTLGQVIGGWRSINWKGHFANVYGTFTKDYETLTFTRETAGDPITVTEPQPFITDDRMTGAGTHIFLTGGNDWSDTNPNEPEPDKASHVIANYLRAVDAVQGAEKHVIIGGVKTRQNTEIDSLQHEFVQYVNSELQRLVPQHFVSRQNWLVNNALGALGLEPTSEDLEYIEHGIIPKAAFSDVTHIRREIMPFEAQQLWLPALTQRGWAS